MNGHTLNNAVGQGRNIQNGESDRVGMCSTKEI